jgi:hypothetical protein
MIVEASIPWPGPGGGCFDPAMVLHRLEEVFGDAFDFDKNDLFEGHYERVVQTATDLGISLDRPVVKSAARKVRELSPRYKFRLRVAPGTFVSSTVDRYSVAVVCDSEDEFPDPHRGQFIRFLQSLSLGAVQIKMDGDPG